MANFILLHVDLKLFENNFKSLKTTLLFPLIFAVAQQKQTIKIYASDSKIVFQISKFRNELSSSANGKHRNIENMTTEVSDLESRNLQLVNQHSILLPLVEDSHDAAISAIFGYTVLPSK